jgi:hypothetical protein
LNPVKKAILSLEQDFNQELVLLLSFQYDDKRMFPDNKRTKIVQLEDVNGDTGISWYDRDIKWESELINLLKKEGLTVKGSNHFYPSKSNNSYGLIEWLNKHEPVIKQYFVLNQYLSQTYFTGQFEIQSGLNDKIDWFEIDINVIIGNSKIPFKRFRKHILAGNKEFLLPDRTVLILPDEWFEKYRELFMFGSDDETGFRIKKIHTSIIEHVLDGELLKQEYKIYNTLQAPAAKPLIPAHTKAELRPYQKEGFYWLAHLYENNLGGCLADDMGLGKTLQTITLIQYIYENSERKQKAGLYGQLSLFDSVSSALPATLVVAPTSLLHNWKNELKRFAPELNIFVYAGYERQRIKDINTIFNNYQVVITSYGIMRNDIDYFREYPFTMIILDESQYIKNSGSLAYQSANQLISANKLVLTGTTIENSL